jgi:hypothetical protein
MEEAFQADGSSFPAGTFYIPSFPDAAGTLGGMARELGVDFTAINEKPSASSVELNQPRVGLWDRYGGSMPSGWVRFVLEEFDFPYRLVFPQELDAGHLIDSFDVIIFPDGAIPAFRAGMSGRGRYGGSSPDIESIPPKYRDRLGSVTAENTIPQIKAFLEAGGTVITLENSTSLGYHLGLPISDYLVDDEGNPLRPEEFFVPGSLLEVAAQDPSPVSAGMGDHYIVNFARSPVFGVEPGASGIKVLSEYRDSAPLRSGWAWGQEKLQGGAAMLEA